MKKIFVLGSINIDLVINAPYMPGPGETIIGSNFMTNPGGKGANQAVACGKQGAEVYILGSVGDDAFGGQIIQNLCNYNVKTNFVRKAEGCTTGIAMIIIAEKDNRIILDSGANYKIKFADVESTLRKNAAKNDIFITQLEIPLDIVCSGLMLAKELGMYTILNPAPVVRLDNSIYKYIDLIIPNESEAAVLSGCDASNENNLVAIGRYFFERGVEDTIITLGGRGSAAFTGNSINYIPAYSVDVADTTAAGDTFIGSIAIAITESKSLISAAEFATAASALTVTKRGAQQAIPWKDEIDNFWMNHKNIYT